MRETHRIAINGAANCGSLNKLRTDKVMKKKNVKPKKLPPTDDSFV